MICRGFEQRILNLFRISIFGFGDFAPLKRTSSFLTLGFLAQPPEIEEQVFDCVLAGRLAPKHAMVSMNKMHPARFAAKSESLESNILARQGEVQEPEDVRLRYFPFWRRCAKNPIFISLTDEVQAGVDKIMAEFPKLVDERTGKSFADPFVVATRNQLRPRRDSEPDRYLIVTRRSLTRFLGDVAWLDET